MAPHARAAEPAPVAAPHEAVPRDAAPLARPTEAVAPASGRTPAAAADPKAEAEAGEERVSLAGRVSLPAGTPADERAFLLLDPFPRRGLEAVRVPVAADGRFAAELPERPSRWWITLEARYLFLTERLSVRKAALVEELVLEPRLGGLLEVVPLPPSDEARWEPALRALELALHEQAGGGMGSFLLRGAPSAVRSPEDDLVVRFGGLAAGTRWGVLVSSSGALASVGIDGLGIEAGEVRRVELPLEAAASVRGHVVDDTGARLAGASVEPWIDRDRPGTRRTVTTDETGAFLVGGLPPGELRGHWSLGAEHELASQPLARLGPGQALEGLRLELARAASIAGRVEWPDGSPAHRARVEAESEITGVVVTDEDGRFRIQVSNGVVSDVVAPAPRRGGPRGERERWIARAERVRAGTGDLLLRLAPALAVEGRVVDARGLPVERFRVDLRALATDPATALFGGIELHEQWESRTFLDEEGRFRFDGLEPGTWILRAEARREGSTPGPARRLEPGRYFATVEPMLSTLQQDRFPGLTPGGLVEVSEGGSGEAVVLRLGVGGTLVARVEDGAGAPVRGARVELVDPLEQATPLSLWSDRKRTDVGGSLRLSSLAAGPAHLRARLGERTSTVVRCEVRAGEAREVVLVLER